MAARLTLAAVTAAALVGGAVSVRTADAESRPGYGGAVVGTLLGEPVAVDPVAARSHAELTVVGLVFDGLYRTAPDGGLAPHLAVALPEVAGDRARIALRAGVTFQDGSPLDAADVVASLRRLARSDAGWILASVAAIDAVNGGVELTLRAPTPDLAALLALPQAAITPDGEPPKAKAPIGSGPFQLVSIDRGRRRLGLRAFDGHFAGRPYLDEIELRWFDEADAEARLFESGGAQLSQRGATVFAGHQPKYAAGEIESPATLLIYVGFGKRPIPGNRDFRQALHLALARTGFAAVGTGERIEPAIDPVPAEVGGASLDAATRAGRLDAAKLALAHAAGTLPALASARLGQVRLEILIDETRTDDRAVAERVVRALDKLGVGATITAVSAGDAARRVAAGACDLFIGQLVAGAPPPLVWTAAFEAGGDPWARRQLAKGSVDPARARAEFARTLPIVPLYHRAVRVHHRRDLRGVGFDGGARISFADLFLFGAPERSGRAP